MVEGSLRRSAPQIMKSLSKKGRQQSEPTPAQSFQGLSIERGERIRPNSYLGSYHFKMWCVKAGGHNL